MLGRRVHLRQVGLDDLERLLCWRNDPEVTEFLAEPTLSRAEAEEWVRRITASGTDRFFMVEARVEDSLEGRPLGYIGLGNIDWAERTARLDIIIGEKGSWGQGYGQDAVRTLLGLAFDGLALERVHLYVLPFNERAIRCYQRVGFRRVGYVKEYYRRRGRLWQPILMEIQRTQYALARRTYDEQKG